MYEWNVVQLNILISQGNRIQVRWEILFYRIPHFIYESKNERLIEIGPHLPKLS